MVHYSLAADQYTQLMQQNRAQQNQPLFDLAFGLLSFALQAASQKHQLVGNHLLFLDELDF
jgi:hypothetical protein